MKNKEIGFLYFVFVGDCLDIDFDELFDFLGWDVKIKVILLYIDNIEDICSFIFVVWVVVFSKFVIVIKIGKISVGVFVVEIYIGGK